MINYHKIDVNTLAVEALNRLNNFSDSNSMTLIVLDGNRLIGTLTDGDIRRGLLQGKSLQNKLDVFVNKEFHFLIDKNQVSKIIDLRKKGIKLIPVIDKNKNLIDLIDLSKYHTKLPLSVLIMAGGKGTRLKPLTNKLPKPMLEVGGKPIIERNIDRLIKFGIKDFYISVSYLKEKIMDYLGDGKKKDINITYLIEEFPLGTIGALSMLKKTQEKNLLVMNADILTDLNFESFFLKFHQSNSDMQVLSIPYEFRIPYAVLQTKKNQIKSFTEKPIMTYFTNGGIYLLNFSVKKIIPKNKFYNATDLMNKLIEKNKLTHFVHRGYWLDIGKHNDFIKSQNDITSLNF